MNKKSLDETIKKMVQKELLKEDSNYFRASKKAIGNDLYRAMKLLKSNYDSLSAGNDFEPDQIDAIIKLLTNVKNSAKKFDSSQQPDDEDYK